MTSTPQPAPGPESGAPALSEPARLAGVIVDPKSTFADIAARPRWLVPLLLIVAVTLAYMIAFSQRVGWERFIRQEFETNSRLQQIPADQREQAIAMQARISGTLGTIAPIVTIPLTYAAIAGLFLGIFNFALGGELKFKTAFAVTCYASLANLLGVCLAILVLFLKNPDDFNLRNPTAFNLGAFLDPQSTPKWLVSAGTSLDLFSIWTVLLLATGFSVAARKVPFSKALVGVGAPWIAYVAIKSAVAGFWG